MCLRVLQKAKKEAAAAAKAEKAAEKAAKKVRLCDYFDVAADQLIC